MNYDEIDDRLTDLEYAISDLSRKIDSLNTNINKLLLIHGYRKNDKQRIVVEGKDLLSVLKQLDIV